MQHAFSVANKKCGKRTASRIFSKASGIVIDGSLTDH